MSKEGYLLVEGLGRTPDILLYCNKAVTEDFR